MAHISEAELAKTLSSLESSAKAAEDENTDKAEEARAVGALSFLQKQAVTAELLRKTNAGKRVNKLCKHASAAVSRAAKATVEAWKGCVKQQEDAPPSSKPASQAEQAAAPSSQAGASASQNDGAGASQRPAASKLDSSKSDSLPSLPTASTSGSLGRTNSVGAAAAAGTWKVNPARCRDDTRDKVRTLIAESLSLGYNPAEQLQDPNTLAVAIEEALLDMFGAVNNDYKAKARSLNFNLKDAKNPDLRERMLSGMVPPEQLVRLTAEEMASDEQKKKNKELKDWLAKEAVRGNNTTATTDMFQCGRCKQRKCTYYQMQTRSADEPMTTFVTCTNCSQRWKFC